MQWRFSVQPIQHLVGAGFELAEGYPDSARLNALIHAVVYLVFFLADRELAVLFNKNGVLLSERVMNPFLLALL